MADLRVLSTSEWAGAVADELAARLAARVAGRLVLPTGDTPAPLYAEIVARANGGSLSLAETELILLDEYVGLEPGDPARCDAQLRAELVDRLPTPRPRFRAIPVDTLTPEVAAAAHDATAAAGIDIALVGLGRNGHVGFNEPGSTADSPTRVVELTDESIAAAVGYGAHGRPTHGITLGLSRLLQASEIWLLVTGAHKAEVLRTALEGPETPVCPASYLRRHPRLVVWADELAAL